MKVWKWGHCATTLENMSDEVKTGEEMLNAWSTSMKQEIRNSSLFIVFITYIFCNLHFYFKHLMYILHHRFTVIAKLSIDLLLFPVRCIDLYLHFYFYFTYILTTVGIHMNGTYPVFRNGLGLPKLLFQGLF